MSGATCSNDIIKRDFAAINAPFPSVAEYEVPAFLADVAFENPTTHTNTLFSPGDGRKAENSVYALWIGTNDLGTDAFLTDSQRRTGATVARDFSDCVWGVFDELYNAGGRHFGELCHHHFVVDSLAPPAFHAWGCKQREFEVPARR